MKTGLKGYHCNNCGAWLLQGEKHVCDPMRLDIIDRIADFLSRPSDLHPEDDPHKELKLTNGDETEER